MRTGGWGAERSRTGIGLIELLALLALGALPTGAQGQSFESNPAYQTARGPISLRDMRPYNLLFLQFLPESADVLPRKANQFGLQLDLANNLLIPNPSGGATVVEDNEYQRLLFSWRRGLGKQTEVALLVPILWRDGGFLDSLILGYHRLFGLPGNAEDDPAGRAAWPQYRSILRIVDANGKVLVDQGNGFGLGETTLTLKRSLIRATPRSALAARLGLKLPTGNPTLLLGSGSPDAGLSLDARYNVGREIILYGNLGGIVMGKANRVPGAQSGMVQTLVGIEYRPNNRDSFILQVDGNSLAVRTGNGFADGAQTTATFGYKRVLDRHYVLSLAYSENGDIHNYTLNGFSGIGPDITFSFGLEWHP
ncbi:MAG TPA: DUF3187 family protein [Chthonomonadaceae bacterium]|nr:DUF3187 family protein [Chthonomonadaceae bacterium]